MEWEGVFEDIYVSGENEMVRTEGEGGRNDKNGKAMGTGGV
jgi:hypothetical protein